MEVAGIFVALASEGLIVFPLSFLCERIQYNRQMGKHFKKPPPRMRGVSDTPCFAFRLTLVYPRAYGVDLGVVEVTYNYRGLSPRVRGRFNAVLLVAVLVRFIPACAG